MTWFHYFIPFTVYFPALHTLSLTSSRSALWIISIIRVFLSYFPTFVIPFFFVFDPIILVLPFPFLLRYCPKVLHAFSSFGIYPGVLGRYVYGSISGCYYFPFDQILHILFHWMTTILSNLIYQLVCTVLSMRYWDTWINNVMCRLNFSLTHFLNRPLTKRNRVAAPVSATSNKHKPTLETRKLRAPYQPRTHVSGNMHPNSHIYGAHLGNYYDNNSPHVPVDPALTAAHPSWGASPVEGSGLGARGETTPDSDYERRAYSSVGVDDSTFSAEDQDEDSQETIQGDFGFNPFTSHSQCQTDDANGHRQIDHCRHSSHPPQMKLQRMGSCHTSVGLPSCADLWNFCSLQWTPLPFVL